MTAATGHQIFLTGGGGFLGKVVLEHLLRQKDSLRISKIYVLLRPKKSRSPAERFAQDLLRAECFRHLPHGWQHAVEPVGGDLGKPQLGLSHEDYHRLTLSITQIIHCAASVEFNLPVQAAAEANIHATLSVLDFAKNCLSLQRMVSVSTAYVRPHRQGRLPETLVDLPRPAADLYACIKNGELGDAEALQLTKHPNTYTLTKCIAEHLLVAEREHVPLTLIRPSIISAAQAQPFPGWIDSHAALAGFIAIFGAGYLRVVAGDPKTKLDVIPVDVVAQVIVDQSFSSLDPVNEVPIVHVTAGLEQALPIKLIKERVSAYFQRYPQDRKVFLRALGPDNKLRKFQHELFHRAPLQIAKFAGKVSRQPRLARQAVFLEKKLDAIYRIFPYFTHHTFDFVSREDQRFHMKPAQYIELISEGIHKHLLQKNPHRRVIAGSKFQDMHSSPLWAFQQPQGNTAIRVTATLFKKALDRMFHEVSFDQRGFERALEQCAPDQQIVIVPSHRSYLDFLLCSYLFFSRPELGIKIPYIAAAEEFSRIPVIGQLFKEMHAFYLKRGKGKEDEELNNHIRHLIDEGQVIQFFIEGQRSRSRHFLSPKRGLLRALQKTGKRFVILPIAIGYERIPEEATLLKQMKGLAKEPMQIDRILQWSHRLWNTGVSLGHVHISCGDAIAFDAESDVFAISRRIVGELQAHMPISSFHLRSFVKANAAYGIHYSYLTRLLKQLGAKIETSHFQDDAAVVLDPTLERSFRMQWLHFLLPIAEQLYPGNAAIRLYRKLNDFRDGTTPKVTACSELEKILQALFEPICHDFVEIASSSYRILQLQSQASRDYLIEHSLYRDRPSAEIALEALVSEGLLGRTSDLLYYLSDCGKAFERFIASCHWQSPERSEKHPKFRVPRQHILDLVAAHRSSQRQPSRQQRAELSEREILL